MEDDLSADGYKTTDIWFASSMAYTFGPEALTRIENERSGQTRNTATFFFDIPSLDAEEYYREFHTGRFAVADLKTYCKVHGDITRLLREMVKRGDVSWTSSSWANGRGR
jgi:hypothetical protein